MAIIETDDARPDHVVQPGRRAPARLHRGGAARPDGPTCSTLPTRSPGRPSCSAYPPTLADVSLASTDPALGPRDWRYVRKDGQIRTMSMTLAPMRDQTGTVVGYLSTAEDITERVRAQSALEAALQTERRAVAHLTEIDRTKDAFVSSVSHELRTPITNIVGYLELLLDGAYGDTSGCPARGSRSDRRQQPPAARADRQPAHPLQPGVARRPALQAAGRPARGDPPGQREGAHRRQRARSAARRGGAGRAGRRARRRGAPRADGRQPGHQRGEVHPRRRPHHPAAASRGTHVRHRGAGHRGGHPRGRSAPLLFNRFYRATHAQTEAVSGSGLGLSIARSIAHLHGARISARLDARARARRSRSPSRSTGTAHSRRCDPRRPRHRAPNSTVRIGLFLPIGHGICPNVRHDGGPPGLPVLNLTANDKDVSRARL